MKGRRMMYWLLVDPINEDKVNEYFFADTVEKFPEEKKEELVDKHFPDKTKSIFKIFIGMRWTGWEVEQWTKRFKEDIKKAPFDIEAKYHSMWHHKR